MYSLQKLKYISTQKTAIDQQQLKSLEKIIECGISQKKISKIWIVNSDDNKLIELNDGCDIKLNVKDENGKILLTKIVGYAAAQKNYVITFILKSDNIPIREIIFNILKKYFKNDIENETFQYMLRCFIITTERQYIRLTQNGLINFFSHS